ncbi:MAG: hypothetical protein JW983_09900 [Elusimicrobia bacterium]|nr:hypothetical protein [Elusimicrobiota bacterium]
MNSKMLVSFVGLWFLVLVTGCSVKQQARIPTSRGLLSYYPQGEVKSYNVEKNEFQDVKIVEVTSFDSCWESIKTEAQQGKYEQILIYPNTYPRYDEENNLRVLMIKRK